MIKSFFALTFLLMALPAVAADLPVLDGTLAKVTSVRVTSQDSTIFNEEVLATIEYNAACVGATSFVVVPSAERFGYTVYEAHARPAPGTVICDAILRATTEVQVATFYEVTPNPDLIKVNGVGVTPTR
jgi:hypothetical protein